MSRPTVMISSTAFDLPEHREQVRDACLRSGFAPDEMMENLNAMDADAIEASLAMVDKADVYIGIFAFRYGYVPDGKDISITEMEYQRAVELKKPRLLFFMDEDHPITAKMVETGAGAEKLKALKERAGKDRVARFFKSAHMLRGDVIGALHEFKAKLDKDSDDPKVAAQRFHRRTPIPTLPTPYIAHPYTLSQTQDLVGRREELNALTDWVAKPGSPAFDSAILCFVAIGGMGKSALTWKWFKDIAPEEMPDLAGRLWWSFYESDAHFENFLNRALCYVGELDEDDARDMPWQDREALLLQHLSERKFLFVLDGLERILLAYNRMDASSLADDEYDEQCANYVVGAAGLLASAAQSLTAQHRLRQTTDPRVGQFLRKLAQVQDSRVLVSTRLYPLALQLPNADPIPGCSAYFLKGLNDDDAVALWRQLGVSGSRQELVLLFNSFEKHSLLIQALAGEIARDRKAPGNFVAWRKSNPSFDSASLPATQVKSHILQHALAGLDDGLRETLTNVVALRTPATYDTLEALLIGNGKTFSQHKDLDQALSELEDRGLIGWDREANRYDAHPIVRSVAWRLADGRSRELANKGISAYFQATPMPPYDDIESLADLTPSIELYHTLIELGRLDAAADLFLERLELVTLYRLAAHRERIIWLGLLFRDNEELPTLTSERVQSKVLNALALSYYSAGQPRIAVPLLEHKLRLDVHCNDGMEMWRAFSGLGNCRRDLGALRVAAAHIMQSLAEAREPDSREGGSLYQLGSILARTGAVRASRVALARSAKIWLGTSRPQREGRAIAYLAELALWQGKAAVSLSDRAWLLAAEKKQERDFIRAALFQGLAALKLGNHEQADERLHHALARTRTVNIVEHELPALIALAELDLARNSPKAARERLDEIWEPAEEGPHPLQQADAYNVLADICLAEDDKPGAIEAATKAYRAAWCDGPPWAYHWGLEKAKAHLQALNAPKPDMPPFDESNYEKMPEVEINPKDEYWVDPNEPLETLLDLDT